MPKNLVFYLMITLFLIPIIGTNLFLSFIGNILLLLFLVPALLIVITFLGLNSIKSNLRQCSNCGITVIGSNSICLNCGNVVNPSINENQIYENPKNKIIEVEAEEVK